MLQLEIRGAQSVYGGGHWGVRKGKENDLQISQKTLLINNTQPKVCDDLFHSFIAQSRGLNKLPLIVTNSVHFRPDVPPACIFSIGLCVICLWSISLRQFGRPFPGRRWNAGTGEKNRDWNLCFEHSDLFTDQSCTHQSVICCGTRCGFCCMSEDSHRSVPCMSKGDAAACPQWPKKTLYIPNQRQGCELDPCPPSIPLVWAHCRCTLLLRSSSIWFGTFLTCLCSKRVNPFTSWYVCGSLGKCAADSISLTTCHGPELAAKLNVTHCKGHELRV